MPGKPRAIIQLLAKALTFGVLLLTTAPVAYAGTTTPRLQGTDTAAYDLLGYGVAIHETTALIGARLNDHDGGLNAGAAYLFDTTTDTQLHKLTADDTEPGDFFGRSVSIHGGAALIGAPMNDDAGTSSGAAYLFNSQTGQQRLKLTADDASASDQFGHAVAVSGASAAVAAPWEDAPGTNAGAVYLFDTYTGEQQRKLVAPDAAPGDLFGYSLALDGELALIGAQSDGAGIDSGSAYLFDTSSGVKLHTFTADDAAAGDRFGSVALRDGLALVGAPQHDTGASNAGAAYLFDTNTGQQLRKLTPGDPNANARFGFSVAIDQGIALIGAYGDNNDTGAVYGFDIITGNELFKFTPNATQPGDAFGFSVSLSGLTAIAGAPLTANPGINAGAAYRFQLPPPPSPILGDLNRDGFVGVDDLNFLLFHWNEYAGFQQPQDGDITGDGFVGLDDLSFMLANWNQGTPPASPAIAPEPLIAAVWALWCPMLGSRRTTR